MFVGVYNENNKAIEVTSLWINEKTNATTTRYEPDTADAFVAGGFTTNIVENQAIYLPDSTYGIKTVSSMGNIRTADLVVGGPNNLNADMIVIPTNPVNNEKITIALYVTNVGPTKLTNVTPNDLDISFAGGASTVYVTGPNPPSVDLEPNDVVLFLWKYKVLGDPGDIVYFSSYAKGTEPTFNLEFTSNVASDTATIIDIEQGEISDLEIIFDDLLNKPGIFLVLPGPFGDIGTKPEKGLFGMNVVNPTPNVMNVSQVVISMFTPRANNGDTMFTDGGSDACEPELVEPSFGEWSCQIENQLVWEGNATYPYVSIPPRSVQPFMSMVHPGTVGGSVDLRTLMVHGQVHTSIGEFGKSGYGTSMKNDVTGMVNLYFTSDFDSLDPNDMIISVSGIPQSTEQEFTITLAELGFDPDIVIDDDASIIINIPRDWNVTEALDNAYWIVEDLSEFSDGSSQILLRLKPGLEIGELATGEGYSFPFKVKSPVIGDNNKLYVMHILADGTLIDNSITGAQPDFPIKPLAEIILQVVP